MHSALYEGTLRHRRYRPANHRFTYPLFMVYLDLDELPEVFAGRWLWSTRRPALARFRRRDYLGDPEVPLAEAVRSVVEERAGFRPAGPIRLLTHLRYFGYGFNPVSFYYCFGEDGQEVEAIVAEVTNTPWKERYPYVLTARTANGSERAERGPVIDRLHTLQKDFHVSPFFDLDQRYGWRFTEPAERLMVHVENFESSSGHGSEGEGSDKVFDVTLHLERRPIEGYQLARVLVRYPFLTAKVVAWIHWNALRLWWKKVPFVDHPDKQVPPRPHRVTLDRPPEGLPPIKGANSR